MSKAAAIKAELDKTTKESNELDQQINGLRERQASLNALRNKLEKDFQREDALEAQAKLAAGETAP